MAVNYSSSPATPLASDTHNRTGDGNCSGVIYLPLSEEFFQSINVAEKIIVALCGIVTMVTLGVFIQEAIHIMYRYTSSRDIKFKTIQILGILPVISFAAFFALCIPKANLLSQLITMMYISVTIYNFTHLMIMYCGGKQKLLLLFKDDKIKLQAPPCCCCCCCLPILQVNLKNVRVLKFLVLQNAIAQPIFAFLSVVFWLDNKFTKGKISLTDSYLYITVLANVSFLFGLYGLIMTFDLCKVHLKPMFIMAKFVLFQLIILLSLLQESIFATFAKYGMPACRGMLSSIVRGEAYFQMVLIIQLLIVSLVTRHFYLQPHDLHIKIDYSAEKINEIKIEGNSIGTMKPENLDEEAEVKKALTSESINGPE
ncbi:unnamed protein product [Lymnaea stagnalis]|uniref:Organic solute transporter subunit alpha n=1 Tax=Lymnaea stagnalis TaxID=6523 RepID=A0AAV2IJC3_LYMST